MLENVAKSLYTLLTVAIPGLFTYGAWRAILVLGGSHPPAGTEALKQIDGSAIVATSIIITIALLQQALAIVLFEAIPVLVWWKKTDGNKDRWPNFYPLFRERFELAVAGRLNQDANRIIYNFFLSANVFSGLVLLLVYFWIYDYAGFKYWVLWCIAFMIITFVAAAFRMMNAIWAVKKSKEGIAARTGHSKSAQRYRNCLRIT